MRLAPTQRAFGRLACRPLIRPDATITRAAATGGGGGSVAATSTAALKAEIVAAISVGAPLYNRGRPADCYSVYRGAAQRLAASPETPPPAAELLRAALIQAADRPDPPAAAWDLRRAFDVIMEGRLDAASQIGGLDDPVPEGATDCFPVLDCSDGLPQDVPRWQALDDAVMGGASSSGITYDPEAKAIVFGGNVTSAFNGGFASVRSLPWAGWAELRRGAGVRLLVRGDGRTYKLNVKADDTWDGVAYQADFETTPQPPGAWQTIDIPFSEFLPNLRGRVVGGQPPLTGGRVRQVGFMVSKFAASGGVLPGFREGGFSLAVRAVLGLPAGPR